MKRNLKGSTLILIVASLSLGCTHETESERLSDLAVRTVELQAQQSSLQAKTQTQYAKLNQHVELSRQQMNLGFDQLEADRRELQKDRNQALLWAEAWHFLGNVICVASPLALCGYLLFLASRPMRVEDAVGEVLLRSLLKPRRLGHGGGEKIVAGSPRGDNGAGADIEAEAEREADLKASGRKRKTSRESPIQGGESA